MMLNVSAIIPVYNEEITVGNVIRTVLESKVFSEVICINDGSTDKSLEILKSLKKIILIDFKKNFGKGRALAEGIRKASGEIIVFIDSDLVGLKKSHLKKLVGTLVTKKVDAVLADTDISKLYFKISFYRIASFFGNDHDALTGERAYYRKDLLPYVNELKKLGYGTELFLNYIYRHKKIEFIKLSKLTQLSNYKKNGTSNFLRIFRRLIEPAKVLVKYIYNNK